MAVTVTIIIEISLHAVAYGVHYLPGWESRTVIEGHSLLFIQALILGSGQCRGGSHLMCGLDSCLQLSEPETGEAMTMIREPAQKFSNRQFLVQPDFDERLVRHVTRIGFDLDPLEHVNR